MSKNSVIVGKKWVKNGKFFQSNSLIINYNVAEFFFDWKRIIRLRWDGFSPQFSPLIYLINRGIRIGLFVHLSLLKKSS
jgi:hypothetical protein